MNGYLRDCFCGGHKPDRVVDYQHTTRHHLTARLISQRESVRCLVAPSGYGKSTVVFDYAELVTHFEHTYWVRAASPCFLRDLDDGVLAAHFLSSPDPAALLVFEDVPCLENDRNAAFGQLLESLLAQGTEVLVTTTPFNDRLGLVCPERLVLDARDLSLTEEEFAHPSFSVGATEGLHAENLSTQAPSFGWSDRGCEDLVQGIIDEDLPNDLKVFMALILLLQEGSCRDIERLTGFVSDDELLQVLEDHYPYLGLDAKSGLFYTPILSEDGCLNLLKKLLRNALILKAGAYDDLMVECCTYLLKHGRASRAGIVCTILPTRLRAAQWFDQWGHRLYELADPNVYVKLFNIVTSGRRAISSQLRLLNVLCYLRLNDAPKALQRALRIINTVEAPLEYRSLAALITAPYVTSEIEHKHRKRSKKLFEKSLTLYDSLTRDAANISREDASDRLQIEHVLDIFLLEYLLQDDPSEAIKLWETYAEDAAGSTSLSRRVFLYGLERLSRSENLSVIEQELAVLWRKGLDLIGEQFQDTGYLETSDFRSFQAFIEARDKSPELKLVEISPALMDGYFKLRQRLVANQVAYRQQCFEDRGRRQIYQQTHPEILFSSKAYGEPLGGASPVVPTLHINLFGSMAVAIGDRRLDPRRLSRSGTKALLALLVLYRGREITPNWLLELLWPDRSYTQAKKSFYTVWNQLKKALTLDGSCPYLIRDSFGCRLADRHLDTDVKQFDDLCRELLNLNHSPENWHGVYERLLEHFKGELLPSERENETILRWRDKYHNQLIDSLVGATHSLLEAGERQGALWFAREALLRDHSREDVYAAQMQAQIASGQRDNALKTYFSCRDYMIEELGIDPSPYVVKLYESILDSSVFV